jgi:hypothetical protein
MRCRLPCKPVGGDRREELSGARWARAAVQARDGREQLSTRDGREQQSTRDGREQLSTRDGREQLSGARWTRAAAPKREGKPFYETKTQHNALSVSPLPLVGFEAQPSSQEFFRKETPDSRLYFPPFRLILR